MNEKKKLYYALFIPSILSLMMILAFFFERGMGMDFTRFGIEPRRADSLYHVFYIPFIHAGMGHLFNNVIAFFVVCSCLYYFYGDIATEVLLFSTLFSGLLLWTIGRESYHVGASGVVFALSFFLFFSGVIRRYAPLIAISLMVVFLYGSNVWHLFPWFPDDPVSWEGHLSGGIVGTILAFVYRKQGPQKPIKVWEEEESENNETEIELQESGSVDD